MNRDSLRIKIDEIDAQLVELFVKRMDVAGAIGKVKFEQGIPIYDKDREEAKIESLRALVDEQYKDYVEQLYRQIFELSRTYQKECTGVGNGIACRKRCGLLGEKLAHSYSPFIHKEFGDYEYRLYEVEPGKLRYFIENGDWDGLNVTIPYKRDVVTFCDSLTPIAKALGSVNVLVRNGDGTITGDNTDAYGFEKLLEKTGVSVAGKKALVLGNGGASASVREVLKNAGAKVTVISRNGENNYNNLELNADAEVIVNTTPVGMYPDNGEKLLDLKNFPKCGLVVDIIYNPARTALILQAEELGIPCAGGLYMLVAQAKRAAELFSGQPIDDSETDRVEKLLGEEMENIILIGMPGCGKSTVAGLLGIFAEKDVIEIDRLIEKKAGMSIPEIFESRGEAGFRKLESEVIAEVSKLSDKIISTGGGCVTVPSNYGLLHQNGKIVWIKRDIEKLSREGRPLSQKNDLADMYTVRRPLYEMFADFEADNNGDAEETARSIMKKVWSNK